MVDNRYRVNAGSTFSLKYHLVWCPKYRKRILTGALEKRLRELLYQKAKEIKAEIPALEIMPTMFTCSLRVTRRWHQLGWQHSSKDSRSWWLVKSYLPSLWSRSYYKQERRDAWKQRVSINYYTQANQLKEIRAAGDLGLANFSCRQDILRREQNIRGVLSPCETW
jgi:putative transposase